ncbi:hypothetical protein [Parablautia intestinalis]|nr:hypothetical protein [Parablautia intestinalis]
MMAAFLACAVIVATAKKYFTGKTSSKAEKNRSKKRLVKGGKQ